MDVKSGAKRLVNESFVDYKNRIKNESKEIKIYLKGKLKWDSKSWDTYSAEKIARAVMLKHLKGGK